MLATGVALAQAQSQPAPTSGARDLFYFAPAEKEMLPPIRKPAPAKTPVTASATAGSVSKAAAPSPAPAALSGARHLGLRYMLLLVKNGRQEAVDPDRNFNKGECVALQFEANHSGYLYVLAKESSGNWHALFPSEELADERNVIDPGQKVRTPQTSCFEIDDPPGTETLFVVLSRAPRDILELQDSIKGAPGRLNSAVEQMSKQFGGSRDLAVRRPPKTPQPKEPVEQAVYVVDASGKPTSTVVTKVEIRHR
jgi:Domain of unknown function (DUF4384)